MNISDAISEIKILHVADGRCETHTSTAFRELVVAYKDTPIYVIKTEYDIKSKFLLVVDNTKDIVESLGYKIDSLVCYTTSGFVIFASRLAVSRGEKDSFLYVDCCRNGSANNKLPKIENYNFEYYSDKDSLEKLNNKMDEVFRTLSYTKILWACDAGNYIEYNPIYLESVKTPVEETYPWFSQGIEAFIDAYLKSDSSILVLYGPPGTGKTSFLKYLIAGRKMNAIVSYDDRLLLKDKLFVEYMSNDERELLIVEDADNVLGNRENENNAFMSKFLNVSEGLIKVEGKKLIFTTNLNQISKIDPALLRKGRCFSAVNFRYLTSKEAEAAGLALNINKDWYSKEQWSLSDVYSSEETEDVLEEQRVSSIGFV